MRLGTIKEFAEERKMHPDTVRGLVKKGLLDNHGTENKILVDLDAKIGEHNKASTKPKEEKPIITEDTLFDDDIDAIRRAKGKKALAEAEIAQAEAEGRRELPEKLAERLQDIIQREEAVSRIELEQQDSRIKINEKIEQVRAYEIQVKQDINQRIADEKVLAMDWCVLAVGWLNMFARELETTLKYVKDWNVDDEAYYKLKNQVDRFRIAVDNLMKLQPKELPEEIEYVVPERSLGVDSRERYKP